MKLLLDEMHAPAVAARLRGHGRDAVAVEEQPEMIGLGDLELLVAARNEGRALVTENVKDFAALHNSILVAGEHHAGVVFTHPRRFPRHARTYVGLLTEALVHFLKAEAQRLRRIESFVWWLEAAR